MRRHLNFEQIIVGSSVLAVKWIKQTVSTGKQCSVYGCFNFAFLQNGIPSGLHFFRIPKAVLADKKQKDRWCTLIRRRDRRDGFSMNSNTICQDTLKKMTFQFQWLQKMDPEALNLYLPEETFNSDDNDVSQSCHYKDLPNTVATQTEWPTQRDECSSKEGIACSTEHN
ncbi:unnamed protein product [Mytilus coruscus]|uniref:THAP-type domain-containing protein n=1 Tax=Mytilus coruscus TaxID=42192 RepID=A0A6J8DU80_MYTCO|nr:unnamed protein product [Mytilus coruscus]